MLEILTVESLNSKNLNITHRKSKKKQIFLYDTNRRFDDFINKIRHRNNGKYANIPSFCVTKLGLIYQLFDSNYYSETFRDIVIDRQFIKIAVENLGWLTKNTITGFLNNWIGDPYRSEPYIRCWRGYCFWDKYEKSQNESIANLCQFLCEKHNIPYNIVPSNAIQKNITKFNGIVCKSNFSNIYTDINPSFNFNF